MKSIYIIIIIATMSLLSCGKKSAKVDTTSIDTASVEQLEQELKNLEVQSNRVNEKLDSINNVINE